MALPLSQIRGTLFGNAVGDALGIGAEFMKKETVARHYPRGLRDYDDIIRDSFRKWWKQGEWTDDTEQLLCIVKSLLANRSINIQHIAREFYRWSVDDGRGIGNLTINVLKHPNFLVDPIQAAREWWEFTGGESAPNGALMRTAVLGVWQYQDASAVRRNAEQVAAITHADPRCIGSCVLLCHAISAMLRGVVDREAIWDDLIRLAPEYHLEIRHWLAIARDGQLADLCLDDNSMGYTLKTLAAALWAWEHADNFEDALVAVINEGGDADTNGAVAGALLGVRFGEDAIPSRWVNGLVHRKYLNRVVGEFTTLLEQQ